MQKFVGPNSVSGSVAAPPSKSLTQRALLAALLAPGQTSLVSPSQCDDARHAAGVVRALGGEIREIAGGLIVQSSGAGASPSTLDCGESGLLFRMMCALAPLCRGEIRLEARGTLLERHVTMVEEPLRTLGVSVRTKEGKPPVIIKGPLRGGTVKVDGSVSSQFLSGLLMALPLCAEPSTVLVEDLKSVPYVEMTLALLKDFGVSWTVDDTFSVFRCRGGQRYQAREYHIEGDWSGASFLFVAAALAGRLEISHLELHSLQADRQVLAALRLAGAKVERSGTVFKIERTPLRGFEFDATDCPDLFPPLAVLALGCQGKSEIKGTHRLQHKESNRASAILEEFTRIGGKLHLNGDSLVIRGSELEGGAINSRADHRIAMAAAVAGLVSKQGVTIEGAEAVGKSYPDFFEVLDQLKARP